MRQQQQQRSRNRNRGRKSSNPHSRNFESNGPDVKIRGNANHIAEKYSVLARDALTSGDTVMAENYFQHAEHYFRIIAATQQSNPQNSAQSESQREHGHDNGNSQSASQNSDAASNSSKESRGEGPQPELSETPVEVVAKQENPVADDAPEQTAESGERSRNRRNGRRPASNRRTARATEKKDDENSKSDGASLPSSLIGSADETNDATQVSEE